MFLISVEMPFAKSFYWNTSVGPFQSWKADRLYYVVIVVKMISFHWLTFSPPVISINVLAWVSLFHTQSRTELYPCVETYFLFPQMFPLMNLSVAVYSMTDITSQCTVISGSNWLYLYSNFQGKVYNSHSDSIWKCDCGQHTILRCMTVFCHPWLVQKLQELKERGC